MAVTSFISDLHLHAVRPTAIQLFLRFLEGPVRDYRTLYILGDLFEVWLGDDAGEEEFGAVLSGLERCTASGIGIFFMHGNRDFLIGSGFAERTGCRLLPDPCVIPLDGEPTLLMHGDALCTDDSDYQAFRSRVRSPEWRSEFLSKPIAERRRIAGELRKDSQAAIRGKPEEVMDVNPHAVTRAMRQHGVRQLIHGHTHRPAIHSLTVDNRPAKRIVLGDWYTQGSVLRHEAGRFELTPLT